MSTSEEGNTVIAHLAIHRPKPEYLEEVLASMHRVDAAAAEAPGLIESHGWREADGGRLVGFAIWESMEAFQAAAEKIFAVVSDDPFDLWEDAPIESMFLTY